MIHPVIPQPYHSPSIVCCKYYNWVGKIWSGTEMPNFQSRFENLEGSIGWQNVEHRAKESPQSEESKFES